ncbi:hypothetical protein KKB83_03605 [Patescibacteria group bacterium]|nr:hypothetical protein [Patescibacteria group bacterium]
MNPSGVNLLPTEYQASDRKKAHLLRIYLICVGELLLLAGAVLVVFTYHSQVRERLNGLQVQIIEQNLFINNEDNRRLEGKLLTVKDKVEFLSTHFVERGIFADFVDGINGKLPPGVRMLSLNQVNTPLTFELVAQTDSLEQVDNLVTVLDDWEEIRSTTVKLCDFRLDKNEIVFVLTLERSI